MKNHEIEWISKYLNIPVEITTDLSLISENEYDQELAKCHIANYGQIYYYTHGIVFVVYPAEDIIDSFEIE